MWYIARIHHPISNQRHAIYHPISKEGHVVSLPPTYTCPYLLMGWCITCPYLLMGWCILTMARNTYTPTRDVSVHVCLWGGVSLLWQAITRPTDTLPTALPPNCSAFLLLSFPSSSPLLLVLHTHTHIHTPSKAMSPSSSARCKSPPVVRRKQWMLLPLPFNRRHRAMSL